jgi:hypothetical protein
MLLRKWSLLRKTYKRCKYIVLFKCNFFSVKAGCMYVHSVSTVIFQRTGRIVLLMGQNWSSQAMRRTKQF